VLRQLRPGLPDVTVDTLETVGTQTALSTGGMVVSGLVRFAYSTLIGGVLGKVALGQVNSSISLALFASLLYPGASAMAVTKFLARSRGAGDLAEGRAVTGHLIKVTYATGAVLGVLTVVASPALLHFSWTEAVITGVLVVATAGYLFARSLLFGAGRVARATAWDCLTALLSIVLLVAALLGRVTWLLLLPLLIGYALYAVCNLPRRSDAPLAPALRAEMNAFIHVALINSLATSGVLQLSMVATQHWDQTEAGSYAAALALATPASLVSRSISSVLFPTLAKAHGRGDAEGARSQVDTLTRGLFLVSLAMFGPLMVVSPTLIGVLFPRRELATGALVLPILLCAVMLQNMVIAPMNTLMTRSQRDARTVMWSSVGGAVVSAVTWAIAAPSGGFVAVAWGYLAGALVSSLIPFAVVWRQQSMAWAAPVLRVALGVGAASVLAWWVHAQHASVLAQVVAALGLLLAWLLVSWRDTRAVVRLASHRA
jgi:putative peptidoglycan lipid II flippase